MKMKKLQQKNDQKNHLSLFCASRVPSLKKEMKLVVFILLVSCLAGATTACNVNGLLNIYDNETICELDNFTLTTNNTHQLAYNSWKLDSSGFYCSAPDPETGIIFMCARPTVTACCNEDNMRVGCECGSPDLPDTNTCLANCANSAFPNGFFSWTVSPSALAAVNVLLLLILVALPALW